MAYRKPEPGLDAVLTDEAIDNFVTQNELKVEREPLRRLWPIACAVGCTAFTGGFAFAMLVADSILVSQVLLVVSCIVTAVATITWFECRRDDRGL